MSTIVTYNRGAQGLPVAGSSTDARLRVWEDFTGNTVTTIVAAANGWVLDDGGGGRIKNGTVGNVTNGITKLVSPDMLTVGDEMSFVVRAKFTGARTAGIEEFAFGFGQASGLATALSHVFAMEVHTHAASADDAYTVRVDDNINDSGPLSGKIPLIAGLEDFDPFAFFTAGAVLRNEGSHYLARFFINGVQVRETRIVDAGATSEFTDGRMGFFLAQPVVAAGGAAIVDYIAFDTGR